MSAYLVVTAVVKDAEKLQQYRQAAFATVCAYKGKVIFGGAVETLAGEGRHSTVVVTEFSDKDSANRWYHSAEYQRLIPLREEAMESTFVVGEG